MTVPIRASSLTTSRSRAGGCGPSSARRPISRSSGSAADGSAAAKEINALAPDLVFLDVQMPEADGFEVLEAVGVEKMPVVVFVTAYDDYALKAFEVHALDYLLKPSRVSASRPPPRRAREEVRRRREEGPNGLDELTASFASPRGRSAPGTSRRAGRRSRVLHPCRRDRLDRERGELPRIHVGSEAHLLRGTIKGTAERLDPEAFLRISRSTIVNLDRVRAVYPDPRRASSS